jgi:conjugal transfer ATP-binding protein TraC
MFNDILYSIRSSLFPTRSRDIEELVATYERDPNQRAQLSDYLPYVSYIAEDQIFCNNDTMGFCLELWPQTGANDEMTAILETIYANLPTGTGVQFHLFSTPRIEDVLRQYASLRMEDHDIVPRSIEEGRPVRNHNIFRQLARSRVGFYKWGTQHSMIEGLSYRVRNFRLLMSVCIPATVEQLHRRDALIAMRESISATLNNAAFPNTKVDATSLINWVADIVNPNRLAGDGLKLEYSPHSDIGAQMVERDTRLLDVEDGILFHKPQGEYAIEARFFTLQSYPQNFSLWQMGGMIGDLFQSSLQFPCPFMITMGAHMLDPDKMKNKAFISSANSDREARSKMASTLPHLVAKDRDWKYATKSIVNGGGMVSMYHTVAVFPTPEQATQAEQAALAIWRSRGFTLNSAKYVQRAALLSSLPMTLSPQFHDDLRKFKLATTKTTFNAVNLAPLIGEWKGTATPAMLFSGRRGQIVKLDLWDNDAGNKNVAIAGGSGSGKSVLINEIAQSYAGMGAKIWIYDLGGSFEKLCSKMKGQYIRFDAGRDICLNPFSMVKTIKEDFDMLHAILMRMASPATPLEPYFAQALGNAITTVWNDYGRDGNVTHVYNLLRSGKTSHDAEQDVRLRDVAALLERYSDRGVFKSLFNGRHNINFDDDFIVIEQEELRNQSYLRQVILMIITYQITVQMYLERHRRKLCIIDEAKDFLAAEGSDNEMMAKFISVGYAQARKYGGSFITATQGVDHYYLSKAGEAAFDNSDWVFLLRQKGEAIARLDQSKKLVMDESMKRMLSQTQTEQGKFSEIFVHSPLGSGLVRLLIDPASLLMFSNRQEDNKPLDEMQAAGMTLDEAIAELLRQRGQRIF